MAAGFSCSSKNGSTKVVRALQRGDALSAMVLATPQKGARQIDDKSPTGA